MPWGRDVAIWVDRVNEDIDDTVRDAIEVSVQAVLLPDYSWTGQMKRSWNVSIDAPSDENVAMGFVDRNDADAGTARIESLARTDALANLKSILPSIKGGQTIYVQNTVPHAEEVNSRGSPRGRGKDLILRATIAAADILGS